MRKHRSRRQKRILAVLLAVLLAAAAAGAYLLFSHLERAGDPVPEGAGTALSRDSLPPSSGGEETEEPAVPAIFYDGQKYVYNEALSTLLILGVDDPELVESSKTRNQSQADFLLLAVFDPESETCTLLQLDRDTMCDVPELDYFGKIADYKFEQLALAHTYGNTLEPSAENTVHAVSRLLYGVTIDNYFSLTMDAIPVLNGLVGGVTVTIVDDFTGIDDTLIKGETVTLTEENVEHFVRSRMLMVDDDSNQARMRRQRDYMTGLFAAMSDAVKKDPSFALEVYAATEKSLVTDCTVDELNSYSERFSDYTLKEIRTPAGESRMGETYKEFYVDETALQKLVIDIFYKPAE